MFSKCKFYPKIIFHEFLSLLPKNFHITKSAGGSKKKTIEKYAGTAEKKSRKKCQPKEIVKGKTTTKTTASSEKNNLNEKERKEVEDKTVSTIFAQDIKNHPTSFYSSHRRLNRINNVSPSIILMFFHKKKKPNEIFIVSKPSKYQNDFVKGAVATTRRMASLSSQYKWRMRMRERL